MSTSFYHFRVKELKDELEAMKNRMAAAERNVTSMDAQRKAAVTEKASLQKEVRRERERERMQP